jgi:RAB protein geranylgeranyltransferase component A
MRVEKRMESLLKGRPPSARRSSAILRICQTRYNIYTYRELIGRPAGETLSLNIMHVQVKKVGRVARAICIMKHPIPDTKDSHSVQIILPKKQLKRKSDMYVFCCSYAHNVAPKGKFIAFVSTEAETDKPEIELKPGIDLLGPVEETFFDIYDRYEPVNNPDDDCCFLTNVSQANI